MWNYFKKIQKVCITVRRNIVLKNGVVCTVSHIGLRMNLENGPGNKRTQKIIFKKESNIQTDNEDDVYEKKKKEKLLIMKFPKKHKKIKNETLEELKSICQIFLDHLCFL